MNWNWQRILANDIGITEVELVDVELARSMPAKYEAKQKVEGAAPTHRTADCPCNG